MIYRTIFAINAVNLAIKVIPYMTTAQAQTSEGKQSVADRAANSGPGNHNIDIWKQRIARISDIAQGDITEALRYIKQTQDSDNPTKIALTTSVDDNFFISKI